MNHRILIVEDNPLNGELLRDWLEVESYQVEIVPDLNAAFAALESQPPDVVLLDVQLGGEDGLSLASWMRHQPALKEIPVIAVTAQVMISERQRILESGCNSIVPKPVDFNMLRDQLQLWLSRAEALQGNRASGKK